MFAQLWTTIKSDLEFFHKIYRTSLSWERLSEDALRSLSQTKKDRDTLSLLAAEEDYTPISPGRPAARWISQNYGSNYLTNKLRPARSQMSDRFQEFANCLDRGSHCKSKLQNALLALKEYYSLLTAAFIKAAPELFSYGGFKISNPFRYTEHILRRVLDAIDYARSLFSKRGLDKALTEGVKTILIRPEGSTGSLDKRPLAGSYRESERRITLVSDQMHAVKGRMLESWIHEVFLHEFGHFVFNRLHPEALALWSQPWSENKDVVVNAQDRQRFFRLLDEKDFDLKSSLSALDGLSKAKMRMWLYDSRYLENPHSTKWTPKAQDAFFFWMEPEAYTEQDHPGLSPTRRARYLSIKQEAIERDLHLDSSREGPVVDAEVLRRYAPSKGSRRTPESLSLPTEYASSKPSEGFSEVFAAYMDNPGSLSPQTRDLFLRTLWLSGFYGKKVLKTASARSVVRNYLNESIVLS